MTKWTNLRIFTSLIGSASRESVLGPLLFLFYINDISDLIDQSLSQYCMLTTFYIAQLSLRMIIHCYSEMWMHLVYGVY